MKRRGRICIPEKKKMKRVKVLQLISSGGYYGAENMLLNLCASQQKAGCQNSLLLFYNVHAPNVEFYERAQAPRPQRAHGALPGQGRLACCPAD